ncbi:OmpA family protein [Mitsuaria sp. WAJ17]|uniref:OmpA family protein n=1 Tax=Mitsuaria sp. WAJ17 TaxID=2761452 RepID=UPI001602C6FF|nr:OmpA family protein [Mitsuaria sp. WAJ17]MBB2487664.1 OmpA family protein [Mitsuaria sp. WAJ17]
MPRHQQHLTLSGSSCLLLIAAVCAATGCASMDESGRRTATGAAVGATAGAVLSSATGGKASTGAVVGGVLGAVAGHAWSRRMEEKQRALQQASAGTGVEVSRTQDNLLRLHVPGDLSFDTGRADLRPSMRPVLDQFAHEFRDGMQLTIVGHTDNSGNDALNQPLSTQRAETVRDYLAARGVPSTHMTVAGRGSREPLVSNDTEQGRERNRRVEILLSERGS